MSNDMTYCVNKDCPVRDTCKRGDVPQVSHWLSKAHFDAGKDGCTYIIPKP